MTPPVDLEDLVEKMSSLDMEPDAKVSDTLIVALIHYFNCHSDFPEELTAEDREFMEINGVHPWVLEMCSRVMLSLAELVTKELFGMDLVEDGKEN